MSKSKKNMPAWLKCEKCYANIVPRDAELHDSNCPPSYEKYVHPLIWRGILNGPLDVKANEEIKGLSYHEKNNLVFLSQSAIQLCSLVIGEWAVVKTGNSIIGPSAKIVWPTTEKALSSVLLTQHAFDLYWKGRTDVRVLVSKLSLNGLKEAKEIILILLNAPYTLQLSPELCVRIRKLHLNRFVAENNKLSVMFYGKHLEFHIKEIKLSENEVLDNVSGSIVKNLESDFSQLTIIEDINLQFAKIVHNTHFKLNTDVEQIQKEINPISLIGGAEAEISELQDLIAVALGNVKGMSGLKMPRGVLLYGSSGTGKTTIANAIAEMTLCHVVSINGPDLYSKYTGETETTVNNLFKQAIVNSPSIILLDEMDILCPVRNSRITEQEKRVVSSILTQIDKLLQIECKVFILATTSRPDLIDPAFRRCGRIDREIEISIPNPTNRLQILKKLLLDTNYTISESNLKHIANSAHGFVGSDLASLCSRAAMRAVKHSIHNDNVNIVFDDFKFALTLVRPSAMREVQIEVPDVKWSDIGGQQHLKLVLRQAVEWPLKHAESFERMGITSPRGVLMYGPPGCSKTMIAKALATESGLNFLSIKGPELFSKWVGESERAVREVFRKARQVAPSVIFFDEIDALGGERSSGSAGVNVQERVLAQLLTELDGVSPLGDVTVLAATNRPDRIDKALLRPGRLDRIVYVSLPDEETRSEIFKLKLAKMPVKGVFLDKLVEMSDKYSGAEIQAVCHEAAMKALEDDINASIVTWEHFEKAFIIIKPRTPQSLIQIYEDYLKN